ncbi:TRAP transporter small permease [Clostridium oceanicum]|uniref:TRAP transporter small permease n=1 Tax=Clostridium oceanicum TaxID=1543 RepID=A0ABP3URK5_9CLOT
MKALKNSLNKILEVICIGLFAFITILGTYQIITRYVFNSPSTISEELLTFSFTWLALLASALVFGKRDHMRMEFVANLFKGKGAVMLSIFSELMILIFAVIVLIYGGTQITKLTTMQITASLGVKMSYIYVIVPISGCLTALYSVINIFEEISKLKSETSK